MADDDSVPLDIDTDTDEKKPALLKMMVSGLCSIKYKMLMFLFILFIFVTSDVFNGTLLKKIDGAISQDDHLSATPYGVVIQGIVLVIAFSVLQFLIEKNVL